MKITDVYNSKMIGRISTKLGDDYSHDYEMAAV